jgi:hypothetical protein
VIRLEAKLLLGQVTIHNKIPNSNTGLRSLCAVLVVVYLMRLSVSGPYGDLIID